MSRTKGIAVENNFIGGLNTEATALAFPTNACTSTQNCIFDETGRVTRRPEIDLEQNYVFDFTSPDNPSFAYTEYMWMNAGGTGLINIQVQQDGANLYFYDISSSVTSVSALKLADSVNLELFKAEGTPNIVSSNGCQYANGDGDLIVVNRACDPVLVRLDPITMEITAEKITIKYRDFLGLDSGYEDSERPAFNTINTMKGDPQGALHFYNLLNQGWWNGAISGGNPDANSALGQWEAARTDMPSDTDYPAYYRASPTDPFDNARVDVNGKGNTLSPKGHFILNLGEGDRRQALIDAGYTLSFASVDPQLIPQGTGTTFLLNPLSGNPANLYDGDVTTGIQRGLAASYAVNDVVSMEIVSGKTYSSAVPVYKATINPTDYGIGHSYGWITKSPDYYNWTLTVELRGHSSAPVVGNEGTLLGTYTQVFNNAYGHTPITVTSSDLVSTFTNVWTRILFSSTITVAGPYSSRLATSEINFYEAITSTTTGIIPNEDVTHERPSTCAFYAGRAWYAGIDAKNIGSNIYFSQIIEGPKNYGRCFQVNDPTSEDFNTLLPSDGGVLRIPEVGKIINMHSQYNSLILLSTNGIWVISGSGQGEKFKASDFTIKKISSLGTQSPYSLCNVNGFPMWWGEDGIFELEYNPQFDSYAVKNISRPTIQSYFYEIDPQRRSFAKGTYDSRNGIVYWLVNRNNTSLPSYQYDTVLCYNTLSKAFYPWDISLSFPRVTGILFSFDSVGFSDPIIKYTTAIATTDPAIKLLVFSDQAKPIKTYTDWQDFSTSEAGVAADAKDYVSYFITGYKLDGETMRFFQSNYVTVFLETETNSGAFLQGLFDFTNSGNSGKWSSRQEVYNPSLTNRDINYRRLKVRGRGPALQLKITSKQGKPFNIVGWSIFETANAEV